MKTGIGSHTRAFRGKTDCWLTPPEIIRALGPFDLDPCAAPNQPWSTAAHHYAPPQDGLQLPWYGRLWLNPPYGEQTGRWLERLSQHGNGIAGMNIDGCRIPCDYAAEYGEKWLSSGKGKAGPWHATEYEETRTVAERVSPLGRWPANLLLEHHPKCRQVGTAVLRGDPRGNCAGRRPGGFGNVGADSGDAEPNARVYGNEVVPVYECHPDCPVRALDSQTGTLTSGKMKAGQQRNRSKGEGGYHGDFPDTASATGTYGDSGGASRFFYCGKATKKERGPGNDHPTVKPLDLMSYLLTLLSTPTGGVVLDPFAGSGTTLIAAKKLGRTCIGVELDAHNCDIAVARLES